MCFSHRGKQTLAFITCQECSWLARSCQDTTKLAAEEERLLDIASVYASTPCMLRHPTTLSRRRLSGCWHRPRKRGRRRARCSEYDIAAIAAALPYWPGVSGRQLRRRSGRGVSGRPWRRRSGISDCLPCCGAAVSAGSARSGGDGTRALPFACLDSNIIGISEMERNN